MTQSPIHTAAQTEAEGATPADENGRGPVGLAEGTEVLTDLGLRPVERLRPGDNVWTRDDGFQPILWHGWQDSHGRGTEAPVRFMGDEGRALVTGPRHRMLVADLRSSARSGDTDPQGALAAAADLVNHREVTRAPVPRITLHFLVLARHAILRVRGGDVESVPPGRATAYDAQSPGPSLPELFPQVFSPTRGLHGGEGPLARPVLARSEARALLA